MEVGDCSSWHHLIFCEELVGNDRKNDIVCWVCKEPVSGYPIFKCLECSFVQHKWCTQLSDLSEMDEHGFSNRHHLIFREERGNNGKENIVCAACEKLASGPTYKCSIPECTFLLHTSCHQTSLAIQHISHRKHTLFLIPGVSGKFCQLCGEDTKENIMFYYCAHCDVVVHKKCASPEIIDNDCDKHSFVAGRKPIKFTCDACGEETEDVASQCSRCRVLTHLYCTHYPRTIKIIQHHHLFSRTYCLQQVKKLKMAICKLCCLKVNTKCGAYYCQVCDYIVHMKCARAVQDKSTINLEVTEFDDYTRNLVYLIEGLNVEDDKTVVAPSKIPHICDLQHELVLNHEDPGDDKRCEACMQFIIFSPFYGCDECNIFLHKRCAQLPETVARLPFNLQPHRLSQRSSIMGLFCCWLCFRHRHGFYYESTSTNNLVLKCDVQCLLIPETINHRSHGHLLHVPTLCRFDLKATCNGCGENLAPNRFKLRCSDCEFWLCFKCATFPLVARYKYHPHLLKLTYTCKDDLEECYCLICEEKRDQKYWFYSCTDCDFAAHIQCVIGSPLISGRHQHPVILYEQHSVKDFPICHSCEESIRDHWIFECAQCKFNFHVRCYYS